MSFQRYFRMLDCQLLALLREVEHIEDDGFCATVLSMVYGVHHLHDSLAFVNDFLFTSALCLEGSDELVYLLFRYVLHYNDVSQVATEVLVISLGEGVGVDDFI